MRFLVTGATGFIGGRLARRLRADGHEVRALVRDRERPTAAGLQHDGIELHVGDVTDHTTLVRPMRDVDGVFHLATARATTATQPDAITRVNVTGTRNVLEAMRTAGVAKGVHTSALAINGDTRGQLVDEYYRGDEPLAGVYERSKRRAHREVAEPLMAEGLPLVIVMPGLVYGPGDQSATRDTFRQYLRGRLPMLPRNTAYCWSHVDDAVEAHLQAMWRGRVGEQYIAAGPVYTFVEAFEIAERLTGIPAPALRVAPGVLRLAAAMMGVLEEGASAPRWSVSGAPRRPTAGVSQLGNDAKARRELGFEPRSLESGLRETLFHEMHALGMRAPE